MLVLAVKSTLSASTVGRVVQTARRLASATSRVVELNSDEEYKTAVKQLAETKKLGVFDFSAKWCGPCRQIAPILDDFSQQYSKVKFYKLDIDNSALLQTVTQVGITAVPSFLFIKGPTKIELFSGARVDMLKKLLDTHS